MKRIAVVLFNLGGPDNLDAVEPFLFNLFHDKAIIRVPQPLRYIIAKSISKKRTPVAHDIYRQINGGSPILKHTQAQAQALENRLNEYGGESYYKSFVAMRYWHPFTDEAVEAVRQFAPDEIVLLPLYPQYSTTTSASSLLDWYDKAENINADTKAICCYPRQSGFIKALAEKIKTEYFEAQKYGEPRLLLSAHGLPEKIIRAGDPYAAQCAMTVEALREELALPNLDSVLCYQSRVGPLKWIGPATDDEIKRAGADKKPIVIAPIAFVSDHSETLVELNIEYRALARVQGVPYFGFVSAVGTHPVFIDGLADLVRKTEAREKTCLSETGARLCPTECTGCPC